MDLALDQQTALPVTTSPRKTRPKRPPGPPVEVMIWRLIQKSVGRGDHRELIDNVGVDHWLLYWEKRNPGPGRYRAELRDEKRAIVHVYHFNQMPPSQGGQLVPTEGRVRPRAKRKVPPPVAAWDPQPLNFEQARQRKAQRAMQARAPQARGPAPVPQPVPAPRFPQPSPAGVAPPPYPGAPQSFARQPLDPSGSSHQPNQRPPVGTPPPRRS